MMNVEDILSNLPEGVSLIRSGDGIIVFTNPRFDHMLGYDRNELLGKHISTVNAPGELSPEEVAKDIIKQLEKTGHWKGEVENIKKDGGHIWCRASVSTYNFPEFGEVWISVHTEISDLMHASFELQKSELKWKTLFRILPVGVSVLDSESKIMDVNPALEKILDINPQGLKTGAYKDRKYVDLKGAPMDYRRFPSYLAVQQKKEVIHEHIGVIKEDGKTIWTDVSAAFLPFEDAVCVIVTADITDHIESELALKKSESRFREFINSSPLGILLTKPDGEILSANQACCDILQMTEEEIKKGGRSAIVDVSDPRLAVALKEREETGKIHAKRMTMIRSGGEKFEAEVSSVIFKDESGAYLTSMALDDISERKKMEEALRESEERFRSIIRLMHEGVYVTDEEGKIIEWNDAMDKLTGLPQQEVLGKYVWDIQYLLLANDLKSEEFLENMKINLKKQLTSGSTYWSLHEDFQYFREPDNAKLYILQHISSIKTSKGHLLIASHMDFTDRKKMEEALKISENSFRKLIENLQVGVLLQGPKSEILINNPKALELLGLTEDQLMGKTSLDPDWNVVHEDGSPFPGSTHPVPMAIKTRKPVENIIMGVYRPSFKDRVWLMVNAEPQLDHNKEVQSVICTFMDITLRHEMEKKMRILANYDQLTLLPNRHLLYDRLQQFMAECRRSEDYGALFFLDLDNFKPLNDQYGHSVGDLLLVTVASRIRDCIREVDTVGRFGGDEFIVIINGLHKEAAVSKKEALKIAEKIRIALEKPYILAAPKKNNDLKEIKHRGSCSIGAVLFSGKESSPDDIINWADQAMYKSKENGKNTITFY